MKSRSNYIIYAPSYDETSGGNIFLHLLTHTLNILGETAFIWPWRAPPDQKIKPFVPQIMHKPMRFLNFGKTGNDFGVNPAFITPQAHTYDLQKNSIVIYPEVTLGNPLNAQNIARWLLYTPGLKDPFEFTDNELFFRAGEMSDIPNITGGAQDLFLWHIHHAYKNENRPDRSGACYSIRKGQNKPRIPETENAICIDGLSHDETAAVFNKCDVFYSYDEATFYSQYAAICGCLSIIVPGQYNTRQEWVAAHPLGRFGVAYGLNDTAHALATRNDVIAMVNAKVKEGVNSVSAFIETTQKAFSHAAN